MLQGLYLKGEEHPREEDPPTAGMFFMNDEGSEVGGLIFGGERAADGIVESHGHLSFDQYGGFQVVALQGVEYDGRPSARLRFWGWRESAEDRAAERLSLGQSADGDVGLTINDVDNNPRIRFLDSKGKVQSSLAPSR